MGECIVVTGATGGIGREVVRLLEAPADKSVRVPVLAIGHEIDLSLPDACEQVVALIEAEGYTGVSGFIHLAGFDKPGMIGNIDSLIAEDLYWIHALFPLNFLGWMAKRANHSEGAAAVLVSSEAACSASPGHAAYAMAKGAVNALALTAAKELKPRGVKVKSVVLGPVDTKMTRAWYDKLPPQVRPELMSAQTAAQIIVDKFREI